MEEKDLKNMIEKFFKSELSIEEERMLYSFLCKYDVPAELCKDKEVIIALCNEDKDVALPQGAEERLVKMLDSLITDEEFHIENKNVVYKEKKRIFKIPHLMWRGAVAVALLAVGYMFMYNEDATELPVVLNGAIATAEKESYEQEEDTFDNPEDAMKCFNAAVNDIKFAFNATQDNTLQIGNMLNKAFSPYKDMIKINIQ